MRSSVVAGVVVSLVLMGGACKRTRPPAGPPEPPTPALGSVSVQDLTPDPERPAGVALDVSSLERRTREVLQGAGLFAPTRDAGAPVLARVRVQVAIEEVVAGEKAAARAALRLQIDTRPGGVAAPRWNEDVQAGAETIYAAAAEKGGRGPLFQKLVGRTLDDLLGAYVSRQKLWSADAPTLEKAMRADGGELRIEAIRMTGERKLREQVPTLLKLLEHEDEAVRDAALGALVELREARAVSVLAQQRSMNDKREMRKILDAVAVLGGAEADDYLGFVADGHDDPEIRAMAKEARQRMARRAADAGR